MQRNDWALGVFLGAFALFAGAVAPGLYLRDSGELTTAAFSLGIAHETGFPLWCLLGKLAALLPFGEVATRLGFFSAICAALAAMWTAKLVARQTGSVVAGIGSAALLVASYTFWKQATVPEVYAPTAAIISLALLLADGAARGDRRSGMGLALLCGLALGLHASLRVLLIAPSIILLAWRLRRGDRWPLLAPLLMMLGALVLAYLPLRAARHPVASWGDPETLGRLWNHLAAARIRRAFADEMFSRNWALVWNHVWLFARQIEGQLGIPALVAAAGGWVWLLARRRALGLLTGCLIFGDWIFSAWVNPMGIEDLQCGVPALIGLAIAGGVGIGCAAQALSRIGASHSSDEENPSHPGVRPLATLAIALALAGLMVTPAALAQSGSRFGLCQEATAWTSAALRDLPARSLALVRSDDLAGGTLYAQAIWGLRPDVAVLVRQHLWDASYLADHLRRADAQLVDPAKLKIWSKLTEEQRIEHEDEMLALLVERNLRQRPIFWEPGDDRPSLGYLAPALPLFLLQPSATPLPAVRTQVERLEALLGIVDDEVARRLEVTALTDLAARYLEEGAEQPANIFYDIALALRPSDAVAQLGRGVIHARRGDFVSAAALAEQVGRADPGRLVAAINAGRYRLVLGDYAAAQGHFTWAQKLRPRAVSPLVGLARVALAKHQPDAARRYLAQAETLAPNHGEVAQLRRELAAQHIP